MPDGLINIAVLPRDKPTPLAYAPSKATLAALSSQYKLPRISKLNFEGQLDPIAKSDWCLTGHLGCSIKQVCGITLEPLTTRIEENIRRVFRKNFRFSDKSFLEMPKDTDADILEHHIDLKKISVEIILLALPDFPRKPGAKLSNPDPNAHADENHAPQSQSPFHSLSAYFPPAPPPPQDDEPQT